jgi:hypothetical protein
MEPMSKKQKTSNASQDECCLSGLKVTKDNACTIGRDYIYAPMVLLFSKYFSLIHSFPLSESLLKEARKKSEQDKSSLWTFIKSELDLMVEPKIETREVEWSELNIQRFWLLYLDRLQEKLLDHLKLDTPNSNPKEILLLLYHGILMLHCSIPDEAISILNTLTEVLNEKLMGEEFWEYNPILLTQSHVWVHDFYDELSRDHIKHRASFSSKKNHIAFSFSVAQMQHPMPEIKPLTESQVCDQQLAIRLARGDYNQELEFEDDDFSIHTAVNNLQHTVTALQSASANIYVMHTLQNF